MAFGGAAVFTSVQESGNGVNVILASGVTLAANVGAFDPTGAAADSGLFNSNNGTIDPVPANTTSLPASFGQGEDNWTQDGVNALVASLNDLGALNSNLSVRGSLVANVNPLPAGVSLTNANVKLGVHNKGAGGATSITSLLQLLHTLTL
jgi:hypothetical protein